MDSPGSVAHAAAARAVTADRFLALIASPAARQAIADIQSFAAARREIRADAEREELTAILRDVARTTTDLVEKHRAATAALRAIDRATGNAPYPSSSPYRSSRRVAGASNPGLVRREEPIQESRAHGLTRSRAHPSRPRSIADFNLGPEDAEGFLERERRENDRLAALLSQVTTVADSLIDSGALAPKERAVVAGGAPSRSDASPRNSTPKDRSAPEGRAQTGMTEPRSSESATPRTRADTTAESGSPLAGRFKAEGPPWRSGGAPSECITQSTENAAAHPRTDSALAYARHILHAVETGSPEAPEFTPEIIESARYYASIFSETAAASPDTG